MGHPVMKCGHAAQAQDASGNPVCVVCLGIRPGAQEVAEQPDLEGRRSACCYCRGEAPSSTGLAFFEHRPEAECDSHYCGCRGWD